MANAISALTPDEQRRAVRLWGETARMVERLRHERLPCVDTAAAIQALSGAFAVAIRNRASRLDSGLVEQQAWFARAHDRPG
jgi:hypothetical protein